MNQVDWLVDGLMTKIYRYLNPNMESYSWDEVEALLKQFTEQCLTAQAKDSILEHEQQTKKAARPKHAREDHSQPGNG